VIPENPAIATANSIRGEKESKGEPTFPNSIERCVPSSAA